MGSHSQPFVSVMAERLLPFMQARPEYPQDFHAAFASGKRAYVAALQAQADCVAHMTPAEFCAAGMARKEDFDG